MASPSDLKHDDKIIAWRAGDRRRRPRRKQRGSLHIGDADKADLSMTKVAAETAAIRRIALQRDECLGDDVGPIRKPVRALKRAG